MEQYLKPRNEDLHEYGNMMCKGSGFADNEKR